MINFVRCNSVATDECVICLDGFTKENPAYSHKDVKHLTHMSCILRSIAESKENAQCPVCRGVVANVNHIPVSVFKKIAELKSEELISAVRAGNFGEVDRRIKEGLTEADRGLALLAAVDEGNLAIVNALVDSGGVSDEDYEEAILRAAGDEGIKHPEILERLIHLANYTEESRSDAIVNTLDDDRPEIAMLLINLGPISDEFRGQAVISAASKGYRDIVEHLLQSGEIQDEERDQAWLKASGNAHFEIMGMLSRNGPISPAAKQEALEWAEICEESEDLLEHINMN